MIIIYLDSGESVAIVICIYIMSHICNPVSCGTQCIFITVHHAVVCKSGTDDLNAHHHLVLGDPAVSGEVLQHRHQKLKTSVPMTQQQHHSNQIDDSHHCTGQIIGHVKNLKQDGQENHSLTRLHLIQWQPWTFLIIQSSENTLTHTQQNRCLLYLKQL